MRILWLIIFIFIGLGCTRVNYNDSEIILDKIEIFEDRDPQFIIDSIAKADTIVGIKKEFMKWDRAVNLNNDNETQITFYFYDEQTKTILSVFKHDNKYIIKHTRGI